MEELRIQKAEESDFPYIRGKLRKYILDAENASWEQFFVAKKADKTVAFGRIIDHDTYFEIASLGVDYYHRKKGIGRELLHFLIEEAKKRDRAKPIYIVSHAPDFFRKVGFEEVLDAPKELEEKKRKQCILKPAQSRIMKLVSG